ncbi:MAG: DegV family EDD domain-containing protein, partial [Myxococcales bacterium]
MPVALVTDSTASLPAELAAARGITVVPLQVVIGATTYDEGSDGATPEMLAQALQEYLPVSTSRPNPDEMLEVYERLAAGGATEIVSVHLSSDLSGTYESALLAAGRASIPVVAVDSRQVGVAIAFAVLAAADAIDAGASAEEAAEEARARAARTDALFYVDTLEYLRRGGRVGAAAALLGSALAVKPILQVADGRVVPKERVRT